MVDEPDSLILRILRDIRAELGELRSEVGDVRKNCITKAEFAAEIAEVRSELRSEIRTLRADVAADLLATRKELNEQISGLRRAVFEYHTTVIGHGALISDLDARMRRVEVHLNLPPMIAG